LFLLVNWLSSFVVIPGLLVCSTTDSQFGLLVITNVEMLSSMCSSASLLVKEICFQKGKKM
jgi:hypothetical protein